MSERTPARYKGLFGSIDALHEVVFVDGPGDTTVRPRPSYLPPPGKYLHLQRPPREETLQDLPQITFEPDKWTGLACIRGTHVTIAAILRLAAAGKTKEEILTHHPDLQADDIRQALEYAARQVEIPVIPE